MELAHPGAALKWHDRDGYFTTPNGSEIWLAGLDDKERVDKVLGKEFATLYFNEASEIPLASYMVAQTRLAQKCVKVNGQPLRLKNYVDLNPTTRNHWTYRMWIDGVNPDGDTPVDRESYAHMVMNPRDNSDNLDADYLLSLSQMPERVKRRFYYGEYTADVEAALWRREYMRRVQQLPQLVRVIVAIDPAVSNEIGSDETGIICAALGEDGAGYVLADDSGKFRPEEWARRAISMARQFKADRIVAEVNQGGDMVEATLRAQASNVPFKKITATRGKVLRAEPISALYERGKIFHADEFSELEAQMCAFTSDFDRKTQGYSPDRVDALVYALTELFPQITKTTRNTKPVHRPKPRFI
jgi:predicted phage terminase large subunit-like protein